MKPNINSVEVHPQLSYNGQPIGWCLDALVGAGSLWPSWTFWWTALLSLWMSHGRQHTWGIVDDGIGNMVIVWDRTKSLSHLARDNYIHVDEWKKRIGDVTGSYWKKAIPILAGCLSQKGKFHEFFYFAKISWESFRGGDLHDDSNIRKRGSNVCREAPGECNRDRCAICNKVIHCKCCPSIQKFRGNYEALLYGSLRGSPAVLSLWPSQNIFHIQV
jgi:hypothetical protein